MLANDLELIVAPLFVLNKGYARIPVVPNKSTYINLLVNFLIFAAFIVCLSVRWQEMSSILFHPQYAGNDARQQLFPFFLSIQPGVFENDIVTQAMKAYLAPLHWQLGVAISHFTQNPVMTGHVMMVIQLVLIISFVFFATKRWSTTAVALLACLFIVNNLDLFKNLIGGLPRGWAGVVVAGFFCALSYKNNLGMIAAIILGCLLNAPAAFCMAASYGIILLFHVVRNSKDKQARNALLRYLLVSPLILCVAYFAVKRDPQIGRMATYSEAMQMPEFQRKDGRFRFLPLKSPQDEIGRSVAKMFLQNPAKVDPSKYFLIFISAISILLLLQFVFIKKLLVPNELWLVLVGIMAAYFAARALIFQLYVPARYLLWPLQLFSYIAMPLGLWHLIVGAKAREMRIVFANFAILFIALPIASCNLIYPQKTETGISGFNKRQSTFSWLKDNTPQTALVAGHPDIIDGVQLSSIRRGYMTTEVAHPFYDQYYKEVARRLRISLQAHYARTVEEFLQAIEGEGIDYFVFGMQYFEESGKDKGPKLKYASYFSPYQKLVTKLAMYSPSDYLFSKLGTLSNANDYHLLPFSDQNAVVLDVNELKRWKSDHRQE